MGPTVSFGDHNFGPQVGINNGTINNEFHHSPTFETQLPMVPEALFNSFRDQHENECLEGTRVGLLRQIREWASSPRNSPNGQCIVFWLNGMAGTGKSTISRSVAMYFNERNALGASFFFKRGEGDRGNAGKLISSIARQFAISIPQLHPHIEQAVSADPGIAMKGMKEQFNKLIIHPLLNLSSEQADVSQTVVILIDALDECDGDEDIRLILHLLPQLQQSNPLHFRVFITSRPELEIRLEFSRLSNHQDFILHEIAKEVIAKDLSLFLSHRLSTIRSNRSLPDNWPGDSTLDQFVKLSSPLFIFAATICRMLEDRSFDPAEILADILSSSDILSKLDRTYLPVLKRQFGSSETTKHRERVIARFKQIVGAIVILEKPLPIASLSKLLDTTETTIQNTLDTLHSVLSVPDKKHFPVRLFHLSFRDFLLDPEIREKTPLYIDSRVANRHLTIQCMSLCRKHLQRNICQLAEDGTPRVDLDLDTLSYHLPSELGYACCYWVYHLVSSADSSGDPFFENLLREAISFLQKHLLHWMEVLSLLSQTSEILRSIDLLLAIISNRKDDSSDTFEFLHYARRFILKNFQVVDAFPLQLYSSVLVFSPRNAIRKKLEFNLPPWLSQLPVVDETWSPALQTLEGHESQVFGVTFSPDGRHLASVSDYSIRVWDPTTGDLEYKIEFDEELNTKPSDSPERNHFEPLAFSPNGRFLASLSLRGRLRVWDRAIKALRDDAQLNRADIQAVKFSPSSQQLAFASGMGEMILYDLIDGTVTHNMIGYRKPALDRVFSPGGCILASGFSDGTIELADLMTGAINHKFEGHSVFPVESLQISPNGKLLVSFSPHQGRTRLWDATSGRLIHEIDTGVQKLMSRRLAFSPDSQVLALVGYDGISLWDTMTGNRKISSIHIKFRERQSDIHDVREFAFTSDSSMLVVAWANKFITGWDCSTAVLKLSYETQPDLILSAALASDGQQMQMASGGVDGILRLWDLAALTALEVESNEIESMSMSANGRLLVSKYVAKTIYPHFFHPPSPFRCPPPLGVWDTTTGVCKHMLQVHSNDSERTFTSRGNLTILISAIAFSPDNQMIALMSNYTNRTDTIQDKISLWNTRTGTQKGTLHTALPNGQQPLSSSPCLEFSRSDLLACGMDYIVILWDTKTGAQLKYWRVDQKVTKLEFFNGGPSLESNLNITGLRKFGHETHLRTNFGVLDSGNDTFWKNPFQVRLVALALRRKRNLRNAFGSMMIRTGEREERTSQMPITLMQDGISGQSNTQNQAISQVSLETNNQWITLNGKKAIWLPPEFRPLTFEVGMRDNHTIIALGLKSGDVCFIGFRM